MDQLHARTRHGPVTRRTRMGPLTRPDTPWTCDTAWDVTVHACPGVECPRVLSLVYDVSRRMSLVMAESRRCHGPWRFHWTFACPGVSLVLTCHWSMTCQACHWSMGVQASHWSMSVQAFTGP
uniref:Uncharacterized protein n=1 Tax=Knipowitschia caucasica TaxID=637954 RepID=A0AAV2IXY9_KNICA